MIHYTTHKNNQSLSAEMESQIVNFLFEHLGKYGDAHADIQKCMDYALSRNGKPGGVIFTAAGEEDLAGAAIVNFTGMEDYIPENILVYIATHKEFRGKGIGKKLMQLIIQETEGNIALHIEPDNPAKKLYESLGFTNKYLEMRLQK